MINDYDKNHVFLPRVLKPCLLAVPAALILDMDSARIASLRPYDSDNAVGRLRGGIQLRHISGPNECGLRNPIRLRLLPGTPPLQLTLRYIIKLPIDEIHGSKMAMLWNQRGDVAFDR